MRRKREIKKEEEKEEEEEEIHIFFRLDDKGAWLNMKPV